jgi:leader peptidase (prepilin peptidase)/N-methyltransferase
VGVLLGAHLTFALVAVPMSLIDLREHRLPDRYTLSVWALTAVAVIISLADPNRVVRAESAVAASALVVLLLWILAEWPGRPLGFGDVKLGGVMGMQLGSYGIDAALMALAYSVILGGVWAAWMVNTKRMGARDHLAFGPFMVAGTLIQLVLVSGG